LDASRAAISTRAVLTHSVGLVDRFLDDESVGLVAAFIVGVGIINGYDRHAGDRIRRARRLAVSRNAMQADDVVSRSDLDEFGLSVSSAQNRTSA